MMITYLRLTKDEPLAQKLSNRKTSINKGKIILPSEENVNNNHLTDKCNFDLTESILQYKPIKPSNDNTNDKRAKPSIERLNGLFSILISAEEKFRSVFDYLGIFRFKDLYNSLIPYANNTERLHEIYCHFQRYITISDNGHIDITPEFMNYLRQVSYYLSDGFSTEHPLWKTTSIKTIQKPVIVLAANTRFYDTFQASMRTVNQYFPDSTIAVYDLGFEGNQLNMVGYCVN